MVTRLRRRRECPSLSRWALSRGRGKDSSVPAFSDERSWGSPQRLRREPLVGGPVSPHCAAPVAPGPPRRGKRWTTPTVGHPGRAAVAGPGLVFTVPERGDFFSLFCTNKGLASQCFSFLVCPHTHFCQSVTLSGPLLCPPPPPPRSCRCSCGRFLCPSRATPKPPALQRQPPSDPGSWVRPTQCVRPADNE